MSEAVVTRLENNVIRVSVDIALTRDMMESENGIQNAANLIGATATKELLEFFDTDGRPITIGNVRMTSKGKIGKKYHTPYGSIDVKRHVYQSSKGGAIYCPLEENARIIITSTPRFSSQITSKSAEMAPALVRKDLEENHGIKSSKHFIQRMLDFVAAGIQAKEEEWTYHTPHQDEEVASVGVCMDGAMVLTVEDGWREAMSGTISLYNKKGERLNTVYIAASPEYGKSTFKKRMGREIDHIRTIYPNALFVGIADGAADNWKFLEKYTTRQILDFYHATEYLADVAQCLFESEELRKKWLDDRCHQLKHFPGAAKEILAEILTLNVHVLKKTAPKEFKFKREEDNDSASGVSEKSEDKTTETLGVKKQPKIIREIVAVTNPFKKNVERKALDACISYFQTNTEKSRMNYAENRAENLPIGSGVAESACKMIVKARFCQSGMRWKEKGMSAVLSLRTLARSDGRWDQFWKKVNQYGFPDVQP